MLKGFPKAGPPRTSLEGQRGGEWILGRLPAQALYAGYILATWALILSLLWLY